MDTFDNIEETGFGTTRAAILPGALSGADSVERALTLINESHAKTPLAGDDVYLFRAEMTNQALDSYFTRMADSSLRNYEADAQRGVPLMNSHRTGGMFKGSAELPVGRSYWGELAPAGDGQRLLVDHYILRTWSNGSGLGSDDLIRGIEGGVIRDTSIGFGGAAWYRCSVCGADMIRNEKCPHLPGLRYEVNGADALAFAWVENGSLIEDSLVYRGATPNAGVLRKASEAIRNGIADLAQVRYLEDQYHVRILSERTFYSVPAEVAPAGEGHDMELEQVRAAFAGIPGVELAEDIEAALGAVRASLDESENRALAAEAEAATVREAAETLSAQIVGLELRAARGDAWLADLIERTIEARVRVQGTDFDADRYREKLAQLDDVDYVRGELQTWEKLAAEKFTAGRQFGGQQKGDKPKPAITRDPAQYRA